MNSVLSLHRTDTTQLPPERFLCYFPSAFVQYFDDSPQKNPRKAVSAEGFDPAQAKRKQTEGCGVYYSPNAFEGGRRLDCLVHIQAVLLDIDCAKEGDGQDRVEVEKRKEEIFLRLISSKLAPHAITDTKNGLQAVWRVHPVGGEKGQRMFREAEDILIRRFGGDKGAKDPTRVLRLPGFSHLKTPTEPYPCVLVWNELEHELYDLQTIIDEFYLPPEEPPSQPSPASTPTGGGPLLSPYQNVNIEDVVREAGKQAGLAITFRRNADGSRQIVEDGKVTSGFVSSKGNFCYSSSGKERKGGPVQVAEYYLGCDSDRAKAWLRERFPDSVREGFREDGDDAEAPNKRRSQADKLIELVTEDNATLFHDQFQEPHAHIRVGDHWQTWRIKSKLFRRWLCALLWEQEQKAAHANAITSALNILEGRACFQGERIALENRATCQGETIWYDLSNEEWSAVRITKEGWTIEAAPPVLFRRQMHQQPQVQPVSGGKMEEVLEFFNLAEGEQPLLLLVYIVSCFLPDIPHPVPILHGPQGAAKTTFARILRRLIDPSSVEVLSMPNVPNDLIQLLSHHWFAFFDNVTGLPEWASDALCRAVTGEGFSKRELYTDDDDVIYAFRRCVGLNGINLAAKKPDLLDRSILFRLERIAKERRQEERVLWRRFDAARPRILGAIFDALAGALRLREEIVLSGVPRMADFTYWGCAIARALGYTQDEFLRVYYDNIDEQHQEAIEGNVVATVILVLMEERQRWTGSASELLKELCDIAEQEKIGTHTSSWPKSVNVLGRRLNEVKTNLAEANILIDSRKGTGGRRIITIERAPVAAPGGDTEIPTPGVSADSPPEHSSSESQEGNSGESGDVSTPLPF